MSYYAVANGRNVGVYDNWEDCKDQVHRYSKCNFRKFDTPDQAWDYVDQNSSSSSGYKYVNDSYNSGNKAIAYKSGNNQVALRNNSQEARAYQRTDYMEGRNGVVVRERTFTSGRHGNGYFVEKRIRTYWEK
ncbi:ribonuclease H1-like [Nylanderia fulva]|uniref:ribonuclease H1-like n=1 Tax=Nylanderia fulva TaxID=613905 RepID=UPI0010FAE0C0|nr:ribonuclease H1-like [Nylanderia fulva]